jgi:hypothetical protein
MGRAASPQPTGGEAFLFGNDSCARKFILHKSRAPNFRQANGKTAHSQCVSFALFRHHLKEIYCTKPPDLQ